MLTILAHPALLLVLGGSGGGGGRGAAAVEVEEDGAAALGAPEVGGGEHDVHEAARAAGEHHGRRCRGADRGPQPQLSLRGQARARGRQR